MTQIQPLSQLPVLTQHTFANADDFFFPFVMSDVEGCQWQHGTNIASDNMVLKHRPLHRQSDKESTPVKVFGSDWVTLIEKEKLLRGSQGRPRIEGWRNRLVSLVANR